MLICWYMQHHQRTYFSHLTTWCHCHFKCWDACGPQCQSQDPHDTFEFWHSNQRSSWLLTEWPQVWWTVESNQSNHFHTWIVYLMDLWLITLKFQVQCIKYWHAVQHEQYTQFSARVIQMLMDGHRLGPWFLRFLFGLSWVWLALYVGPSWGWLSHISWAIIIYILYIYVIFTSFWGQQYWRKYLHIYIYIIKQTWTTMSPRHWQHCHKTFGIPQLFSQIEIENQSDMNSSGAKCHFFTTIYPFLLQSPILPFTSSRLLTASSLKNCCRGVHWSSKHFTHVSRDSNLVALCFRILWALVSHFSCIDFSSFFHFALLSK